MSCKLAATKDCSLITEPESLGLTPKIVLFSQSARIVPHGYGHCNGGLLPAGDCFFAGGQDGESQCVSAELLSSAEFSTANAAMDSCFKALQALFSLSFRTSGRPCKGMPVNVCKAIAKDLLNCDTKLLGAFASEACFNAQCSSLLEQNIILVFFKSLLYVFGAS